ncbi:MAG TPA: MFS transporter [Bryobacteraceae bacterium]|nr:MFS transporter [Bryobacteraceae bacterium]
MTPERKTVDVAEIIERQKLGGFLIGLVLISWIITFFDGFDSNLISFAAPYFSSQYHLSRIQLGNIFSMGLLGTLIGGFILGYVGDRLGRRPTVVLATAGFGVLTMCFALADSYPSLWILRLIDGIPLGGMLPLAWALNIEYVPTRFRATIVTVVMMGYSLGTALGGPIAVWLIPKLGWQAVFIIGGIVSLASAGVLFAILPESIRFLASKGQRPDRIAAILRRIAPGRPVPAEANFIVADEGTHRKNFKPSLLFQGELRWITPFIWVAYIFSSMAVFFIVNWTPLVFEALHFTRGQAATAASLNSAMGAVGGLLLMRFTDKRGAIAITAMPIMTFILLLIAGLVTMAQAPFLVLSALIGGCLIGGHFGMHSICGIFYPSAYRANGAGWATSVAKIGSVAGPILGGVILSTSLPVRHIFVVLAVCPAVFAICIYVVGRMHTRILGREALAAEAEAGVAVGRIP